MQYLDFNIIKQAVKDGVDIQILLNSLLYEDSIGIYDYENDRLIYEIWTFEDIIAFMENMENMENMDNMDNIEDIKEWVLLIFYVRWYYLNTKGLTWFIVYKLSENEDYHYKLVKRIEDWTSNTTEIKVEYFENEKDLLRRLEWINVGSVLYVEFMDYDLPKEIREYLTSNEGRWVKFTYM